MSQAGRQNQGGGPIPPGTVLKVQTQDHAQATPDGTGIVYFLPRPDTVNTTANIMTQGTGAHTFYAAVTDSIYLPATAGPDGIGSSGIYGIERTRVLHTMGGLAARNVFVGFDAGNLVAGAGGLTGTSNTFVGTESGLALTSGSINCAIGSNSLRNNQDGGGNMAIGTGSLLANVSGNRNIAIGTNAGSINHPNANDNINIGNAGDPAAAGRTTIGTVGFQTRCYIHGIRNVAGGDQLVTIDANGQLGSQAVVPTGIQFINVPDPIPGPHPVYPDVGDGHLSFQDGPNILIDSPAASTVRVSVTPNIYLPTTHADNTQGIYGFVNNAHNNISAFHVAGGVNGIDSFNTGIGANALNLGVAGDSNTACGAGVLAIHPCQSDNSAFGAFALRAGTGSQNTVLGAYALDLDPFDGNNNIIIGSQAGNALYQNASTNIIIGNNGFITGVPNVNNTISIGSSANHTSCYMAGIYSRPINPTTQNQVVIDASGKLGSIAMVPGNNIYYEASDGSTTLADGTGTIIFNASDTNLTSHAAAHAVAYRLSNSINIVNNITAGNNITATIGNITATTGNIISTAGSMTAHNNITSTAGDIISTAGDVVAHNTLVAQTAGANITGNVYFNSLATGVLQVSNAGHQVTSSNGTNGQILRARGSGILPSWNTLVGDHGIAIDTSDPDQITISYTGVAADRPAFYTNLSANIGFIWGNWPIQYIGSYNGTIGSGLPPINSLFNHGGTLTLGSPGNPARYTAITGGLYNFVFKIQWQTKLVNGSFRIEHLTPIMTITHYPSGTTYNYQHGFYFGIGREYADSEFVSTIGLLAGESVTFGVTIAPTAYVQQILGITTNTFISGFLVS